MKKLQTIDESKLLLNPFVNNLQIEATKLIDTGKFVPDEDGTMIPVTALIEKKQNVKLFYCSGCKDMIYNLSPGAKSLYLFVLYNLDSGQDWIQLNSQWYMAKNNIKSINTYKEAVKELCRYLFLAQTADYKDVFWINPMLFFSGNRIAKYPGKVKIVGEFTK
jgi:hypothetical protein